jgi:hypothetical protein
MAENFAGMLDPQALSALDALSVFVLVASCWLVDICWRDERGGRGGCFFPLAYATMVAWVIVVLGLLMCSIDVPQDSEATRAALREFLWWPPRLLGAAFATAAFAAFLWLVQRPEKID